MPQSVTPPTTRPFVFPQSGVLTREGLTFLIALTSNTSEATAGDVLTPTGSGLDGGGAVVDGLTLSIAPFGVENGMIREGMATSVIGRFQGSDGEVADIQATGDNRVLGRFDGILEFRETVFIPAANYTVAGLPDPAIVPVGAVAFATDARNAGEGVGTGTGSLVANDGTIWKIPGVATAVAA